MSEPLSILTHYPPAALAKEPYSEILQAKGDNPPFTWSLAGSSGSLPPGMSLSAAGVLSAPVNAIPDTAVGDYSIRLRVVDSIATAVELDVIVKVTPSKFHRIPGFLADRRYDDIVDRVAPVPADRLKVEKHLIRDVSSPLGNTIAHYDRDIRVPDWRTPGNNPTGRDVLEALYTSIGQAIKTINAVNPDALQDFKIQAGPGLSVGPIVNGIQIDLGAIPIPSHGQKLGSVLPGAEMKLALVSAPDMIQGWMHETVSDIWYRVGNVPSYAGKRLNPDIHRLSNGIMAMASGFDPVAVKSVLHTIWCDMGDGSWNMSRFDQLTMDHIETFQIAGAGTGAVHYPLIMTGIGDTVFAAFIDGAQQLYFVAKNPNDYTNVNAPFTAAPVPLTGVAGGAVDNACHGARKVLGCTSITMPFAYISTMTWKGGGPNWYPVIVELGVGGGTWAPTGNWYELPLGGAGVEGSFIDMLVDQNPIAAVETIFTFGLDQVRAFGALDTLLAWNLLIPCPGAGLNAVPMVPAAGVCWLLENVYSGDSYKQGCVALDDDLAGGATRRVGMCSFTLQYQGLPKTAVLRGITIKDIWGPAPGAITNFGTSWRPSQFVGELNFQTGAAFSRWYGYSAGPFVNQSRIMYFDWMTGPDGATLWRSVLDANYGWINSPVQVHEIESTPPPWLVPSNTMYGAYGSVAPFILCGASAVLPPPPASDNVVITADPRFGSGDLRLEWRPSTLEAVIVNNSPFQWDVKIDTFTITGPTFLIPPNLMIACYQLAGGLSRFFSAWSYFPSPSIGAMTPMWSEAQLAATPTGGKVFSSYYSVTPGQYDLLGGTVAQARYFADEGATTASDQTLVFRYNSYPPEITAAEAAIQAQIVIHGLPILGAHVNPNFYTLAEMDVILGTAFATLYATPPYSHYRYFCFTDPTGMIIEHGFYSQNFVDTGIAYGPHPVSSGTIPVDEAFLMTADEVANVSTFFDLSSAVSAAEFYVNGVRYREGLDWRYNGMAQIEYFNRQGVTPPYGYVLHQDDEVVIACYRL